MQHFPVPRLKSLNKELAVECDESVEKCILHIYRVISIGSEVSYTIINYVCVAMC